ncbi:hypothetical protein IMZ31_21960 (plasmid) [Pontibacillus sp. ALD_SL1]|uniref:hypothetical protein n=1 Tax=Pontibacillus sp. ALD_SL1 TaxID=2777185 RepID=UPI001A97C3EC|nr:hypothetical protein [Pontibacillus sp. ALD_SL1]QST02119.1 hypothetical protein IMZ31_21960 [Pontibacillus sp. ALD_SL1]
MGTLLYPRDLILDAVEMETDYHGRFLETLTNEELSRIFINMLIDLVLEQHIGLPRIQQYYGICF